MFSIVFAVLFLLVLFLIKNGFSFANIQTYQGAQNGLVYSSAIVGDLVNKSTAGDGIPDWEKVLYGLDPTKRENTPGVPDSVTIAKLKATQESSTTANRNAQSPENLTQTDKFSRELFSTVAALNQSGAMNQATVNQISASLANRLQNSGPKKVYLLADIKVVRDNSVASVQKYYDTLNTIYKKYRVKGNVPDILQRFMGDGKNIDVRVLEELNPIITQVKNTIEGITKINVPADFAQTHLDIINGLERLAENLNDIKLYDSDAIVTFGAVSQYQKNSTLFETAVKNLSAAINQKLRS